MLKIFQSLKENKIIKKYEVLDFKQGDNFYYIKIKSILINQSILTIREYNSINECIYSYHWQKKNNKLIYRWDNAPYHKKLKTFPYHRHSPNKVEESDEIYLEEILKIIEKNL